MAKNNPSNLISELKTNSTIQIDFNSFDDAFEFQHELNEELNKEHDLDNGIRYISMAYDDTTKKATFCIRNVIEVEDNYEGGNNEVKKFFSENDMRAFYDCAGRGYYETIIYIGDQRTFIYSTPDQLKDRYQYNIDGMLYNGEEKDKTSWNFLADAANKVGEIFNDYEVYGNGILPEEFNQIADILAVRDEPFDESLISPDDDASAIDSRKCGWRKYQIEIATDMLTDLALTVFTRLCPHPILYLET
jgi:hypothetical protein